MTEDRLRSVVRAHYPHADAIFGSLLRACAHTGLPLSYALALVEKESEFENVFGHDPVRSIRGGRVSRARYLWYKARRRLGFGMQGVGYTQLTWYALQDAADKLGGCWRAYPNLVVGFGNLRSLIRQHGEERGAAAYNGVGAAAEAYGRDFVHRQRVWHERLA